MVNKKIKSHFSKTEIAWGVCEICHQPIEIPGDDGYLCSNRECGLEIVIWDKKKKQIVSRHPAKGWVKRADIPELIRKRDRDLARAKKTRN